MSTNEQALNGFKTFLVTFIVSLVVFGGFYYLVTDDNSLDSTIESEFLGSTKQVDADDSQLADYGKGGPDVKGVTTVFGELAAQEPTAQPAVVLGGGDTITETTESSVPETGVVSMTIALIISSILLGIFAYITILNPRGYVLSSFEKKVLKDL